MTTDPFAGMSPAANAEDGSVHSDYLDNVGSMTMGEKELDPLPAQRGRFIKPAEHSWIPVRITAAGVEDQDTRAVLPTASGGEEAVSIDPDHPASVLRLHFDLEAELVADAYGERPRPYLLRVPIFDRTVPYRYASGRRSLGFPKMAGRRLLDVTAVVDAGQKVTRDNIAELAQRMVGEVVMARVRYSRPKTFQNAEPLTDENNQEVRAQVDPEQGTFVKVVKTDVEEGRNPYYLRGTDIEYGGDPGALFEHEGNLLIRESDLEISMVVQRITESTVRFDNLADDVAPLPNRDVTVTRRDGTKVKAEITFDSLGEIVSDVRAGTLIQAVDKSTGVIITATWLGGSWSETPEERELEVTEDGRIRFVPVASQGSGAAMFRGD